MRDSTTDRVDPGILIDTLPIGVIVTDLIGTVVHANRRAEEFTGYTLEETRGRSMLDFIAPDDLDYVIAVLSEGHRYHDVLIGPSRIRYRTPSGEIRWTEYWAHSCPPEFGFEGYVLTLSTESVGDNLSQAVHDIAVGESLDVCLASIARAVRAFPLVADGTILLPDGDGFRAIGTWPLFDSELLRDISLPWHEAARTGEPLDLAVRELPEPHASHATAAGFHSLWIRPVITDGGAVAVFVAWRREGTHTSANQERQLDDTVGVARLAFMHDAHRRQLQRAAMIDALTGAGNRTGLQQRLDELGDGPLSVLFIDLDGFKHVNDTHGHDVGDRVLAAATDRISAVVRTRDAVFRIGGDEFLVVCDTDGDAAVERRDVERIADRIVTALGQPFRIDDELTVQIGASVGAASRRPEEPVESAIQRSDQALLEAKRSGKAQWRLAEHS